MIKTRITVVYYGILLTLIMHYFLPSVCQHRKDVIGVTMLMIIMFLAVVMKQAMIIMEETVREAQRIGAIRRGAASVSVELTITEIKENFITALVKSGAE